MSETPSRGRDATRLVRDALALLDTATGYGNRGACWIARAGLECLVDDLLAARGCSVPRASMRSRLAVLQALYASEQDVARRAEYAWQRLSTACHHHAYELTPSGAEVRSLIDVVIHLLPARKAASR